MAVTRMRRTLLRSIIAATAATAACRSDGPPVPKTIVFTPSTLSLDAIGRAATLTAEVKDDRGRTVDNATVTWTASGSAATLQAPAAGSTGTATHTATLTATHEGETIVTATSGNATATLNVVTDQVPFAIVRVDGDAQVGAPNAPLPSPIRAQVIDRLGVALTDRSIAFAVIDGGGSVSSALAAPNANGIVEVTWTLGTGTIEHLEASLPGTTVSAVRFTATAVEGGIAALVAQSGGNEAIGVGADATPPAVRVVNSAGAGVPGVVVGFSVTAGGGTISAAAETTGADGVASLTRWTMGPVGSLNRVTATANGAPSLDFSNAGCESGAGTGYGIALCYRTVMTTSQRQAFVNAAAKWSSILTGDLPDVASIPAGLCGGSVPTFRGAVDDLLIFATIEPIDGAGDIVGSAGPCFLRASTSLPSVGSMRFDVEDIVTLENRGLLNAVILHEMGHVLGIGTLWSLKGLVQNPSTAESAMDTFFNGPNGLAGFDQVGGATYTGGNKVPVENKGGAGTINAHWRESVLDNEALTGTVNGGRPNPLSVLTVRSLEDLGYTVNAANADPFFLTLSARVFGATEDVVLENDVMAFPLWTVDGRGQMKRVPR